MAKQVFIHTWLSRAYLALARLSCHVFLTCILLLLLFIQCKISLYLGRCGQCGVSWQCVSWHPLFWHPCQIDRGRGSIWHSVWL